MSNIKKFRIIKFKSKPILAAKSISKSFEGRMRNAIATSIETAESELDSIREEIKKLIELNGGKVSSSISKNTSFILAGENMGPSKKQKAEELEVKIISEEVVWFSLT